MYTTGRQASFLIGLNDMIWVCAAGGRQLEGCRKQDWCGYASLLNFFTLLANSTCAHSQALPSFMSTERMCNVDGIGILAS